jgi:MscS family membrane protein
MRDLIEQEKIAEAVIRETTAELKQSGELPRTPLQLMVLLAEAGDAGNWERAGAALDMRYLPEELEGWPAAELIQALRIVWNQQNIVDITQLSDQPEGHLDDGLPSYRDLLGVVRQDDGTEVPIFLQRIPDGQGGKIWKISNATVAEIPALWDDLGYGPDRRVAAAPSSGLSFRGACRAGSWSPASCSSSPPGTCRAGQLPADARGAADSQPLPPGHRALLPRPPALFLFLLVFRVLMDQLALSLTARVYLNSSGVDYIAFSILLLGLISLLRDYNIRRLERAGNRQYVALLKPFTTIVKIVALTIIALVWAERPATTCRRSSPASAWAPWPWPSRRRRPSRT